MIQRRHLSKSIYRGKIVSLSVNEVRIPKNRFVKIEVVGHPGGAAILPIFDNGDVLLIRQYRPVIGKYIWEIPAGKLEPGETSRRTVARELKEETGYRAKFIKKLGSFQTTPGFCNEVIHLYEGRHLHACRRQLEEDEVIEVHRFKEKEVKRMIVKREITDGKTLVALFWHLGN